MVTTKHTVLSRFKVTARTKYDAVAELTDARHKGEGLPDTIQVAGIESSTLQIHSVGVIKGDSSDPDEPEVPDDQPKDPEQTARDHGQDPSPPARRRGN